MIATSALNSIANAQTIKASEGNTKSTIFPVKHDNYLPPTPSTEQIKQRIADVSQEYGLDYDQLYSVIKCESEFKITYGDSGKAFGVAQFHKPTFDQYCKGNYCDTYDQLNCMAQMFKQGQAKHWTCFKKLYTKVIYNQEGEQLSIAKN